MTTAITAPAAPNGDHQRPPGRCSRCGKIWTLKERRGVCRWCGKPAQAQIATTKSRHVKSRRKRKQTQANGIGNGYDQLPEPYLTFYNVALPFAKSVPAQDGEDLLHTIISNLADAGRSNGHKPDNPSWMYRIASFAKSQYFRDHYRHTNGLDCGRCTNKQRRECKDKDLRGIRPYRDCPKAIKIESLNRPTIDSDGNLTEYGDLIADDKALDLAAWVDSRTFLLRAPVRLLAIGMKRLKGIPLDGKDQEYLRRFRQQEQKRLL